MSYPVFRRRSHLPYFLELIASSVARVLYRVRTSGAGKPALDGRRDAHREPHLVCRRGGVAIGVSAADPVCGASRADAKRVFQLGLRDERLDSSLPEQPRAGMKAAVAALKAGEVVCVCPEGHISRTGQLMEIQRGFEVMARQAEVPVVAAAIDGLWGSVFSFAGNKYLWKSPRLMPTHVFISFGAATPPEKVSTEWARRELLDLGRASFEERPVLKRHLGRECIRALAKHPWRVQVIDRTVARRELTCGSSTPGLGGVVATYQGNHSRATGGGGAAAGSGGVYRESGDNRGGQDSGESQLHDVAGRVGGELQAGRNLDRAERGCGADQAPNFPWPERTLDLKSEIEACGGKRALLPWMLAAWLLPNQLCADLLGLPRRGDREEAGLLFTSGSSGEPKGVVLSHRNILANCAQISSLSILPETCSLLGCLPVFHSFGFTVVFWYPLLRGCHVVTVPSPLDTRKIIDAIRDEGATVLIGAPTFIRPVLKKALPAELRSLDLVVTGAEKLPDDLARSFMETFHIDIMQGYGLTETTPAANINQPHPPVVVSTNEPQLRQTRGCSGTHDAGDDGAGSSIRRRGRSCRCTKPAWCSSVEPTCSKAISTTRREDARGVSRRVVCDGRSRALRRGGVPVYRKDNSRDFQKLAERWCRTARWRTNSSNSSTSTRRRVTWSW